MIALKDVLTLLDGELLTQGTAPERAFDKIFASDLMSDVLSAAQPGSLLLTGLANVHVVSACAVADLTGVVFVQGKRPGLDVVAMAQSKDLPLIATRIPMFEACGRMARFLEDGGHGRV